jgi:hypothetical protein
MISVLLLGSAKRERAELSRHAKIRSRCKNTDGRLVRNAPKDSPSSVPLAKQSNATQNPHLPRWFLLNFTKPGNIPR